MSARKKQSKCPEPINTLLDLAGAVTLGLYAKNKIKRDFGKKIPKSLYLAILKSSFIYSS